MMSVTGVNDCVDDALVVVIIGDRVAAREVSVCAIVGMA